MKFPKSIVERFTKPTPKLTVTHAQLTSTKYADGSVVNAYKQASINGTPISFTLQSMRRLDYVTEQIITTFRVLMHFGNSAIRNSCYFLVVEGDYLKNHGYNDADLSAARLFMESQHGNADTLTIQHERVHTLKGLCPVPENLGMTAFSGFYNSAGEPVFNYKVTASDPDVIRFMPKSQQWLYNESDDFTPMQREMMKTMATPVYNMEQLKKLLNHTRFHNQIAFFTGKVRRRTIEAVISTLN